MSSRWEGLFADLAAQAEAEERAELDAEVRDRTRREGGLAAHRGPAPGRRRLHPRRARPRRRRVSGRLLDAGPDWLLLEEAGARDALVPLGAGPGGAAGSARAAELGTGRARRPARPALGPARAGPRPAPLQVLLRDGAALTGTLDRVGADHVELAEHDAGEARRAGVRAQRAAGAAHGLAVLRAAA